NDTHAAVFFRNRVLATTELVSVAAGTTTTRANGDSDLPAISGDGHYVVFESHATNLLVTGSTSGAQFFVRDIIRRSTELVGAAIDPTSSTSADVQRPSISSDGRFVAFARTKAVQISANPLIIQTTSALSVRDRLTATTQVVTQGTQQTTSGFNPSISADGRFVAFDSRNPLLSSDTNENLDVFLFDLATGTTERVSVSSTGSQGNSSSFTP